MSAGAAVHAVGGPVAVFKPPADLLPAESARITGVALNWCGSEALITVNDGCVFRLDVSGSSSSSSSSSDSSGSSDGTSSSSSGSSSDSSSDAARVEQGALMHYTGHRNDKTIKQVQLQLMVCAAYASVT
jgi:hypothetical protein